MNTYRRNRYNNAGLTYGHVVFLLVLAQICTGAAVAALSAGNAWIQSGSGIHPIMAGIATLALITVPYLLLLVTRSR